MSEFLVITGLAGAGGSTAATIFEDLGWFVIDNLPAALVGKVAELARQPGTETERVALVVWSSSQLSEVLDQVDAIERAGDRVRVLFLESSDEAIVRRYEDGRRPHPQATDAGGLTEAIARERAMLEPVKARADLVVDTTDLNVHQLREKLTALFTGGDGSGMRTAVLSFGYKHGLPLDVDVVLDCRHLPNPHWVDELRPFTGLDEPVRAYVLEQEATTRLLDAIAALLDATLEGYAAEGKSYLTIALGCTGGRHRSVVLAEEVARLLRARGHDPVVEHRDMKK